MAVKSFGNQKCHIIQMPSPELRFPFTYFLWHSLTTVSPGPNVLKKTSSSRIVVTKFCLILFLGKKTHIWPPRTPTDDECGFFWYLKGRSVTNSATQNPTDCILLNYLR
jgi:hypothetical protein